MTRFNAEDLELVKFFDIITHHELDKYIFHIANERRCSIQEGKNLKRKGVKPGVLDVLCMIASNEYNGLWIEFKSKGQKLTKKQSEFVESALEQHYMVQVVYSSNEAIKKLSEYLKNTAFLSYARSLQQALAGMQLA